MVRSRSIAIEVIGISYLVQQFRTARLGRDCAMVLNTAPKDLSAEDRRADKNIENLKVDVGTFLKGNHHSVIGQVDPQSGHYVLTATGKSDVDDLANDAGIIVHQLRSSLDVLARRLVIANSQTPDNKTAFPIYIADPAKSSDRNVLRDYKRKIRGMSLTAQTLIEKLQPYNALGSDNPLAIINEMDITDKHHDLVVLVPSVRFPRIQMMNQFAKVADFEAPNAVASEAKDGVEVGRIIPLMGDMKVQVSTSFDVALSKVGLRKNQPLIPTLKQLRDATVDIIDQFRSEFR
jgi:hypothetical protein